MYKLTYETDDDVLVENPQSIPRKSSDKELIIYDKNDKSHSWTTNKADSGRRNTISSAINAGYGVGRNSRKISEKNTFNLQPRTDAKKRDYCSIRRCENCLFTLYLFAITAVLVVLFIYVKRFEEENKELRKRLDELQFQVSNSQDFPLQQPFNKNFLLSTTDLEIFSQSNFCCNSVSNQFRDLKSKLARTSNILGSLQQASHDFFRATTNQYRQLQQQLQNLNNTSLSSMSEVDFVSLANELFKAASNETNVAFKVIRANYHLDRDQFTNLVEGQKILFGNETINVGNSIEATTGIFTSPVDGIFIFFVSFCSDLSLVDVTEVVMSKNNEIIDSFQVPAVTNNSSIFAITPNSKPFLYFFVRKTESEIKKHRFFTILNIKKGDQVHLILKRGAIIELATENVMKSEYCTEYSGFMI